jgi:phosphoenolpyruvate carboxylase
VLLLHDAGDGLCQTCFVVRGLAAMVEIISNRTQQSLIDRLLTLSQQAHQRGQTDAAYHSLAAAYHAAYESAHLEAIIREAQQRVENWEAMLDECGEVRAQDYRDLVDEAQEMQQNVLPPDWR